MYIFAIRSLGNYLVSVFDSPFWGMLCGIFAIPVLLLLVAAVIAFAKDITVSNVTSFIVVPAAWPLRFAFWLAEKAEKVVDPKGTRKVLANVIAVVIFWFFHIWYKLRNSRIYIYHIFFSKKLYKKKNINDIIHIYAKDGGKEYGKHSAFR